MSFKSILFRNLSNIPGWSTRRKILVIESDDWGSIRMPSEKAYHALLAKGLPVSEGDSGPYNLYDTLADKDDLSALFEVLQSVKDKNRNPAVFTAFSVTANPDFEKIKSADFKAYYYELFPETLKRYYGDDSVFQLWKEGIRQGVFIPQFHGREHLNVPEWMRALQRGDKETLIAFDQGMWGFPNKPFNGSSVSYQAAFDFYDPADIAQHKEIITDGLKRFNELFGYKSTFFVPPNGFLHNSLIVPVAENGIKYLFASRLHSTPAGYGKSDRSVHYLGQKNKAGQTYIIRNCFFEPAMKGKNWVDSCMNDIEIAFRWKKPAIISAHRVNFIGAIHKSNRENGLSQLRSLLSKVVARWPETEFMSSDKLGDLITGKS